jgi:hypothetical protein
MHFPPEEKQNMIVQSMQVIQWINIYPADSFEQLGPAYQILEV